MYTNGVVLQFDFGFHKNPIFLGDFNIHISDITNTDGEDFRDLLMALGLQQIVDFPTHVKGNTLDLIISSIEYVYKVSDVKYGPLLSDHFLISAVINFPKPKNTFITYQKLKGIDMDQMIMDMHLDHLKEFRTDNVNNLLKEFEDHIIKAMDIHAPSKTMHKGASS